MKNLIKNKPFIFGFLFGGFLIALANVFFAINAYLNSCFDCYLAIGFPYPVYERWAISRFEQFFWMGIIANILITSIFSSLCGLLFKFVLLKFVSKRTEHNPKSEIYDKAFKFGFWTNILLFLTLNYFSYLTAYNEYLNKEIQFSVYGYTCGFPFLIYEHIIANPSRIGLVFEGVVLNAFITVVCGFIMGSIFRFVWSKIKATDWK